MIFNDVQYPWPHITLTLLPLMLDAWTPCNSYGPLFSMSFNDFPCFWTHITVMIHIRCNVIQPIYGLYILHMKGHGSHIWPNVIYGPCMAHNFVIWSNGFQRCSVPLTSYNVMAIDFRCLDPIYGPLFSMSFTLVNMPLDPSRYNSYDPYNVTM